MPTHPHSTKTSRDPLPRGALAPARARPARAHRRRRRLAALGARRLRRAVRRWDAAPRPGVRRAPPRCRAARRASPRLDELGSVELSWAVEQAHDAVLALPGGELALLVSHGGTCEIVVAARSDAAARAAATTARRPPALRAAARQARPGPLLDEHRQRVAGQAARDRSAALEAGRGQLPGGGPPRDGAAHAGARARRGRAAALARAARHRQDACPARARAVVAALVLGALRHGSGALPRRDRLPHGRRDVATARRTSRRGALVVLEDAGELMSASARSETGQGLSRVLNLTDGMLGQGVKCILLVTTNEPLGRLHPAVRRPGRCWATIEFGAFRPPEATAWLAARGVERDVTAPMTLAELYAVAERARARDLDAAGGVRVRPRGERVSGVRRSAGRRGREQLVARGELHARAPLAAAALRARRGRSRASRRR